jgi:hypothetical protein
MNKLALGALVAAGLATSIVVPNAHAAPSPKANGGVIYLNTIGEEMHLQFNASGTPDAGKGRIHFRNPVTGVSFTAAVECFSQAGNQAQFSGPVISGGIEADSIRVVVVDNGEPETSDLVRVTRRPEREFDCAAPNTAVRPVVHGNAQVMGEGTAVQALLSGLPDEQPGDEEL